MDPFTPLFILLFLAMLSLLVAAHEYGHFLVARLCKMDVEEFAIGFGKPYWTYMRKKGTEYNLRPLPLGGFVRIKGMQPEDDGSEVSIENGFYSKPPLARFLTLLAGPVFSILAGLLILIPLHTMHGRKVLGTTIESVETGTPAYAAGLRRGDRLTMIDGVPVLTMFDVMVNIRDKAGQEVVIQADRAGTPVTVRVVPELTKKPTPYLTDQFREPTQDRYQARIGMAASLGQLVTLRVPPVQAIGDALMWPVDMVKGLIKTFMRPSTIKENMGGPVTIATQSYAAAKDGWDSFVQLAALLSISLGIFNLLPFAPLDGGQMVMAFVEMLRRGKRLSVKVQATFQGIGLLAVFGLIASVFFADFSRLANPKSEKPVQEQKKP